MSAQRDRRPRARRGGKNPARMRGIGRVTVVGLCALALGSCGGGERQDKSEASAEYKLDITRAEFPAAQSIAQRAVLTIAVKNSDSKTVPNVAVTIKTKPGRDGDASVAFGQRQDDPRLADPARPVWVVDRAPTGGDSAYTNTWTLGPLASGETKTFEWHVTAVKAGDYSIGYEVFPGLQGKAKLASSSKADGSFAVKIADTPPNARVGANGQVIRSKPGAVVPTG